VSGEPLLALRGVRAGYGSIEVLHGVDLDVPEGAVVAVLGPNGAGKTTMLRVLAGLHPATGGDIVLAGRRVNGARADDLARAGPREVEATAFERFPRLAERRTQLAGTLSGGEQQMLALARGLASRPALLVLDELSMGLAPLVVEQLYEQVAAIAATGVSILVVEQFAKTVLGVADSASIMVGGTVVCTGSPDEIEADLSTAYLGGTVTTPAATAAER
jgi:branched-chain amino acid transport system ATP-binding protein